MASQSKTPPEEKDSWRTPGWMFAWLNSRSHAQISESYRRYLPMIIHCKFSPDRKYRYLWRHVWNFTLPPCVFVGLNPSTADEDGPDPTVRRCIGFARAWGYGALLMLNLFAYRATDPRDMKRQDDPIGPENDAMIKRVADWAGNDEQGIIVAAWGNHGAYRKRADAVLSVLMHEAGVTPKYLGLTKAGHPKHPLYLKGDLKPQRWG